MAYQIEITDTFGGEPNFCWVRRYDIPHNLYDANGKRRQKRLIRAAKRAAGWAGMRCTVEDYGNGFHVRPVGRSAPCWIMFVIDAEG
jgi:hypothetical protein